RVAHEVYAAALPGGAQNLDDGGLQTLMRIRDHKLRTAQAAACQAAQELDPERLGLAVTHGHAEHLASSIGVDANRDDDRDRDDVVVAPCFDVSGIQPDIAPLAFNRAAQEGSHPLVDLAAQSRDLALGDALHSHGPHQIVDRAGRDALDIGFLDYGGQRLLGQTTRFEKGREVAAAPQLRDAQFDRTRAGLPVAVTVAVALVAPLRAALAVPGAAQSFALQLHQALGSKADHLAQECRIGALLQKRTKGDLVVGHRGDPQVRVACATQPYSGTPRWPLTGLLHHHQGHDRYVWTRPLWSLDELVERTFDVG